MECESPEERPPSGAAGPLQGRVFAGNSSRRAFSHRIVLDAPDGTSRAFSFGVASGEVPSAHKK